MGWFLINGEIRNIPIYRFKCKLGPIQEFRANSPRQFLNVVRRQSFAARGVPIFVIPDKLRRELVIEVRRVLTRRIAHPWETFGFGKDHRSSLQDLPLVQVGTLRSSRR